MTTFLVNRDGRLGTLSTQGDSRPAAATPSIETAEALVLMRAPSDHVVVHQVVPLGNLQYRGVVRELMDDKIIDDLQEGDSVEFSADNVFFVEMRVV